jgi:hypothetical protein
MGVKRIGDARAAITKNGKSLPMAHSRPYATICHAPLMAKKSAGEVWNRGTSHRVARSERIGPDVISVSRRHAIADAASR